MTLDDHGRTPKERKTWLKERQKYWRRTTSNLTEKIGGLQTQLRYLQEDYQQAKIILIEVNTELGE